MLRLRMLQTNNEGLLYKNSGPNLCFKSFLTGNADMCLESSHTNSIVYLYENAVRDSSDGRCKES